MPLITLDYDEPYPPYNTPHPPHPFSEIIGRPKNLAWPVEAWRVTLPKREKSDDINMFERVILKIIDACGIREADELAQEICIPVDLVKSVLFRLKDKGFIDENNEIVNQGRDKWMAEEEKEPVSITAILFRELATGKILPFLHWLDNPLRKKEIEKFREITYYDRYKNKKPKENDVIYALQAMRKRSMASDAYSWNLRDEQIIITNEPEQFYLDCPIAIQKRDGEFRIADPFCNVVSLLFERSFSQLLEQDDALKDWLIKWKSDLSNPKPEKQSETPREKEPFDNEKNWGRYRNLVYNLAFRKRDAKFRSIEQIHSALEWALFYASIQRQYDATVQQLKFTDQAEHSSLLKEAAKKIGLDAPPKNFLWVPEGKLDDFLDGNADMVTLISITLLMAEKDKTHPLHKIANIHQDFITRLFNIKKKRDYQDHKGKFQKNEVELPEDEFMREIVTVLLPDIRFSDTYTAQVNKDTAADEILDSRTSIQNEFGFKNFNRLGTDLQERLIFAERFWLSCKDADKEYLAGPFVFDLSAALQAMFRKKLTGILPPDIDDSEFIERARANAAKAGLGELPEALSTVRTLMIRKTLQGDDQTLGACAVVFLLVANENDLKTISQNQPSFLSDIADITVLRGHTRVPLPMKKDAIEKIRKSAYSTIKTLLEV